MATKIFLNLPVKDLERSKAFFSGLGFTFNAQFSDDKAACMIIADNIFAMLLTNTYFKTFTSKEICDSTKFTEVLIALDTKSRDEVQTLVAKAKSLGGQVYAEAQDHGWMYQHSFADLDGHQWELAYMDESQIPAQ